MKLIAVFSFASLVVGLSAVPVSAQDHTFHAAGTAPIHVAGSSPVHVAGGNGPIGGFAHGGHVAVGPLAPVRHRPQNRELHRHNNPYGYGYAYGVPYYMPYYDTGYDQSDNQDSVQMSSDPRTGPTVFEHNGQPSSDDERYAAREQRQEPVSAANAAPLAPTVLIFRDGHQQEIESYAIAGNKLIVLGERPQKIALSDLDIDATAKLNDDRGVDFRLPNQS